MGSKTNTNHSSSPEALTGLAHLIKDLTHHSHTLPHVSKAVVQWSRRHADDIGTALVDDDAAAGQGGRELVDVEVELER